MTRLTKQSLEAMIAALDVALAGDGFDGGDFAGMDPKHFERAREWASEHEGNIMSDNELLNAAKNAALTIGAIYEWLERVEKAGGATSIEGVAACNAMLKSLRKNADRTEKLVMEPLRAAIAASDPGRIVPAHGSGP